VKLLGGALFKLPNFDFSDTPFSSGLFFGLFVARWCLLIVFISLTMMMIVGVILGGSGTVLFVYAFMALFLGYPWSLSIMHNSADFGPLTMVLAVAVGYFINGLLLGVVVGVFAMIRQMIRKT